MSSGTFHEFATREALAEAVAQNIARLAAPGFRLALSGGTTPKLFLGELAKTSIEWSHVTVTLVDERMVPQTHERSNARLLLGALTVPKLRFVPLFENEVEAAKLIPLSAAVLGMGSDGHTASFFPGGDTLDQALDPQAAPGLIHLSAPNAGEPRITFNLSGLLQAETLALHIEGREKREVLEKAMGPGPAEDMPIRAILRSDKPLDIYWCP